MQNLSSTPSQPYPLAPESRRPIRVLLVDDQPIVGEAVSRMLQGESDIEFRYCSDPTQAIPTAEAWAPTVILQDLAMPEVDGLTLVKFLHAHPKIREIPLVVLSSKEEPAVKAEAFALGANDYLVKLPDAVEVIARIRYHSRAYLDHMQRLEAYEALELSQKRLAAELAEAALYVESTMPERLDQDVQTDWLYLPSMELGGDSLGYHWLDDDHFALYLLDVSGHGVGAALLSVSVTNALRASALPHTDFHDPADVLQALNTAFPMARHHGMFFTIWYGVYNRLTRELVYSGGGHPAAILVHREDAEQPKWSELCSGGLLIGVRADYKFSNRSCRIESGEKLYLYSDGAFEIFKPDGCFWSYDEFVSLLGQPSQENTRDVERIVQAIRQVRGGDTFDDDFSLLQFIF